VQRNTTFSRYVKAYSTNALKLTAYLVGDQPGCGIFLLAEKRALLPLGRVYNYAPDQAVPFDSYEFYDGNQGDPQGRASDSDSRMSGRVLPLWQLVTMPIAMARFSAVVMMVASFQTVPV
jgi:hypothetical protein